MAELIAIFKNALSFNEKKNIVIDSWEFKCSSQFTPFLLLLASMAVTARQFFGEPIQCDDGQIHDDVGYSFHSIQHNI